MATYIAKGTKCSTCQKMNASTVSSGTSCTVQGSYDYIFRTFLQFDLSGIPEDASIISATMYVLSNDYYNDNAMSGTTNIARVTSEWDETTCCWNNMPSWTGNYLTSNVNPPKSGKWAEWDITTLVQEWVYGCYPNYGLHVRNNNEGGYRFDWGFYTYKYDIHNSDDGDDTNNRGAYIKIEYTEPTESTRFRIRTVTLTDIANETRRLAGTSSKLTPLEIAEILSSLKK